MALAALATVSDLSARGITVTSGELTIVGTYLNVASAAVRQAAGTPISQTTTTVEIEGTCSQWLRLPGGPVTAVATVTLDGTALVAGTLPNPAPESYLLRSGKLWRQLGWATSPYIPATVVAAYTHGLLAAEVPADIIDLVCRLAATTLVAYRAQADGEGLATSGNKRQETLADYSVTWSSAGEITEMVLADKIVERLAARFGNNVSLVASR